MAIADVRALLQNLCKQPTELGWLEFKENRFDPDEIGRYVSGLANSAMLEQEERAYLVFGVRNQPHEILGTSVRLKDEKIGNQIFEHWLARHLQPRITVEFVNCEYDDNHVELIVIDPGYTSPVRLRTRLSYALSQFSSRSEIILIGKER